MNSYLNSLLETKNISQHDGRPLWKYDLSDDEYAELKNHISHITEKDFDPRDITLFYAEWWKNEYNGGFPSKIDVYNAISNCNLPCDDFYKYAKKGAILLGIKWIQRENRLYFRTLLLQGGLPINNILNPEYCGQYTNFLKKVLEINPSSIGEFAYEDDITRILPFSCRNDAIYESCLQIVQAIWSGKEDYLAIFENRGTSTSSFKKISDELKKHKEEIEKKEKKQSKFRAYWVLNRKNNVNEIKLTFNFPDIIEKEDFIDLLQIKEYELNTEYQLIINDLLVCKIKKNILGNYKVFWFNNSIIFWDGEETKQDIYLSSFDGKRYDFPILLIDNPKISEPTLWTQKTDNEWILNRGRYCKQEKAALIFNNDWFFSNNYKNLNIVINNQILNWYEFEGELQLVKATETIIFKTNSNSFDWFIKEEKPLWALKSNIPIVRHLPQIIVYDKSGERIEKINLLWRKYGEVVWNKWANSTLPIGCIEYKIAANGCEEKDCLFNIGNLDLDFETITPYESIISIQNNNGLNFEINDNEILEIGYIDNEITVNLTDIQKMPKSIKVLISNGNQNRKLHLEIIPPFQGIRILDPKGNILIENSEFIFGNFMGYRIFAPIQNNNFYIKIYNTNRNQIAIIKKLPNSIIPLREYEVFANRLFLLTDTMDSDSSVTIELMDFEGKILSKHFVKNHNKTLSSKFENERLEIEISEQELDIELFAIPLDCHADNIELHSLTKENYKFVFKESSFLEKFIIISELNTNSTSTLLPCYISTNQYHKSTSINDRKIRIQNDKDKLLSENSNGNSWGKIKRYYKICLNNDIPFSTFDIFRASASSPELSAKLFCLLNIYNDESNFLDKICKDLEDDLGFCFHWISKPHWENAINWIKLSYQTDLNKDDLNIIAIELRERIFSLINNCEPMNWFDKIADYTINGKCFNINGFHFNTEVRKLGESLGEKVLVELPVECPKIDEELKVIMPVHNDNFRVKILLKTPLAVALSISGKDERIWEDDINTESIRRNIQYCQWLAPDWYGKAIIYCLSQLSNSFKNYKR